MLLLFAGSCCLSKVNFKHAHSKMLLFVEHKHSCDKLRGNVQSYKLEYNYSSIARVIVNFKKNHTEMYLRLTNPGIVSAEQDDNGYKDRYRANKLGCESCTCNLKKRTLRLLGKISST